MRVCSGLVVLSFIQTLTLTARADVTSSYPGPVVYGNSAIDFELAGPNQISWSSSNVSNCYLGYSEANGAVGTQAMPANSYGSAGAGAGNYTFACQALNGPQLYRTLWVFSAGSVVSGISSLDLELVGGNKLSWSSGNVVSCNMSYSVLFGGSGSQPQQINTIESVYAGTGTYTFSCQAANGQPLQKTVQVGQP